MRDEMGDRPRYIESIKSMFNELAELARTRRQSVLDVVSDTLLKELEARGLNRREAAALMGVSLPTYRKMLLDSP